jgi:hypothetical protein
MFDPTIDFTEAELAVINLAEVTVPMLREYMTKFPELELDAAIGGLKMQIQHEAEGLVTPVVPETAPVEAAPEVVVEKTEEVPAAE